MIEHETAVERLLAVTEASYERRAQLQTALDSRVVIEQAKGVKIRELASRVRPGCETPAEIAALLDV